MNFNRGIITIAIFSFLCFLTIQPAFAATKCETQYGGKQVCVTTGALQINKEVFDPQNKKYVDNLGLNDYRFAPSELVSFKISAKNTGDSTLNKVTINDIPQAGFFELATGSLNFEFSDLKPGETKSQEIKLRVIDASKMPQNNVICVINTSEGIADNDMRDKDTSQVCLERKVLAVQTKELPKTGPADWLLTLVGSAAGLLGGAKLKRMGGRDLGSMSNYQMTEDMVINKRKVVN